MHSAREIIESLELNPHPEGGHYREIYRSAGRVRRVQAEDGGTKGQDDATAVTRTNLTTIYYLLERGEQSRWHVVTSDETWHFYDGEPLELFTFSPNDSEVRRTVLGRLGDGKETVAVVPPGVWQAARSLGAYSLVGCTVGPGFEFEDFAFVSDLHVEQDLRALKPLSPYLDLL